MSEKIYDLAILGAGPGGTAAAVYAARKNLKAVLIAESFGGQSIVSEGIENWIGNIKISGANLAKNLEEHVRAYAGEWISIKSGERIEKISKIDQNFEIITNKDSYLAKSVLITTGSSRKKLQAKNADIFEHKGITYCASCDGPVFADQDVVVVGGGNAGFESAAQLSAYTNSVTIMHRRNEFKADPITVSSLLKNPKIKVITNAEPTEILGEKFVTGMKYLDKNTSEEKELKVTGIFVEIGATPATSYAKDLVKLNETGHVVIDHKNQRTSLEGVWSAGDCTDGLYHQNNIAAGDAVKALEDIYIWLKTR